MQGTAAPESALTAAQHSGDGGAFGPFFWTNLRHAACSASTSFWHAGSGTPAARGDGRPDPAAAAATSSSIAVAAKRLVCDILGGGWALPCSGREPLQCIVCELILGDVFVQFAKILGKFKRMVTTIPGVLHSFTHRERG